MNPNVRTALGAAAATGIATPVRRGRRPGIRRRMRAQESIAAKARIGAGSIEYWKWKDQKLDDDDQKRSRNEGIATMRSGETRGSRMNAMNEPAQTRAFSAGVTSSFRLSNGCRTTNDSAESGPLPS